MADQSGSTKKQLARFKIAKTFYAEAYTADYLPTGGVRLYRVTRAPSLPPKSTFAYQSVRIKSPEELSKIKPALDYLAGKLGWQELPPLLKELEDQLKSEQSVDPEILKIVRQYPRTSIGMLKAFDEVFRKKVDIEDLPLVLDYFNTVLDSISGKQKLMIDLQLDILNRLGNEKSPGGMQSLLKLLQQYELPQLTSVTSIITDRLQRLRFFEAEIQNEHAYEIKGVNSIHNQLAKALWIIDDSYWLLHSNEPLTNFLRKRYSESSEDEKRRPDLICCGDSDNLVIVELKRPSHRVTKDDINQLQDYLVTADEYYQPAFRTKQGFIIANEISAHDQKVVENIRNVQFRSYSRLIEDCKKRYQEYLDAIRKGEESSSSSQGENSEPKSHE